MKIEHRPSESWIRSAREATTHFTINDTCTTVLSEGSDYRCRAIFATIRSLLMSLANRTRQRRNRYLREAIQAARRPPRQPASHDNPSASQDADGLFRTRRLTSRSPHPRRRMRCHHLIRSHRHSAWRFHRDSAHAGSRPKARSDCLVHQCPRRGGYRFSGPPC